MTRHLLSLALSACATPLLAADPVAPHCERLFDARSGREPGEHAVTADEIRAMVGTAKDHGDTVVAHARGKEGMRRAVEAGLTGIDHGTRLRHEGQARARVTVTRPGQEQTR